MNVQPIVETLQRQRAELLRLGVKSLRLFGSRARGEDAPSSGADFVVEFVGPSSFDRFMDLRIFLEDTLGVPIDLVTEDALRPALRKSVERDALRVA